VLDLSNIFDQHADFDPAGDFDLFLSGIPAKWVVYLFSDATDQAVQLLCVKNLRASLKRRLNSDEAAGLLRTVNYRELVRRIYWRRVDSSFEADLVYLDAARAIFPGTYQGMVGFRPAWFVHVDPEAEFPRYVRTIDLQRATGLLLGPVEDKHAAGKLIAMVEDAFDLCRYYQILVQAPDGRACAYKEMGKCPAPCDGSISMMQYRGLIQWSAQVLCDPRPFLEDQTARMQSAASDLQFEAAGKIKHFIEDVAKFDQKPFHLIKSLADFIFFSLQPGSTRTSAKVFLITPWKIHEIAHLLAEPSRPTELWQTLLAIADEPADALDDPAVERVGVVAHHLFAGKHREGIFLRLSTMNALSVTIAWRALKKQRAKSDEPESDGEGVMKELQAM